MTGDAPIRRGRAVGIDLGSRRIGIAVTDSDGTMALPRTTLVRSGRRRAGPRRLVELVLEEEAVVVVVGLPLSLDGSRGRAATEAAVEADALRRPAGAARRRRGAVRRAPDHRLGPPGPVGRRSRRAAAAPDRRPGRRHGHARGVAGRTADRPVTARRPAGSRRLRRARRVPAYRYRSRRRRTPRAPPDRRPGPGPEPGVGSAAPGRARRELGCAGGAGTPRWLPLGPARGQSRWPPGGPGHRHGPVGDRRQSAGRHPGGRGGHLQLAGLPDLEPVPRDPSGPARVLRLQQEQQLRHRRPGHLGRSQRLPPRRPPGLHRGRGGHPGGPAPRPHQCRLRRRGHAGDRALPVAAGRLHQPRRPAGHRRVRGGAGGDRHQAADRPWSTASTASPSASTSRPGRPGSG